MTPDSEVKREEFNPLAVFDKPKQDETDQINLIRSWDMFSLRYPLGIPNDVALNVQLSDIKTLSLGDIVGVLPIGYNVFVHTQDHPRYEGKGYIMITGFERGPDRDIDYISQPMHWRLQYHARPTTIEEVVKNEKYKRATQRFVNQGVDAIQKANANIRVFMADNHDRKFSKEYLELYLGRHLASGKFYASLIEGLTDIIPLDQNGTLVKSSLEFFSQTKKQFEFYYMTR